MTDNKIIVPELNQETIKSKIYEIRGQKVMLDFELAEIYGYTTSAFNQQVKNNNNKFPSEFMFQISRDELNLILKSKNLTSSWGGTRKLPYVFTEQGVYMLMTVVKGELATKQSIALIKTFKEMKDYISNNSLIGVNEVIKLVNTVNENTYAIQSHSKMIDKIESQLGLVMENFVDPSMYKHFLILDNEKIEADVAYQEIYKLAKRSIYIIDDYVDAKTFELLKIAKVKDVVIMTDNKSKANITMLLEDANITAQILKNKRCHDRYIIIDYKQKNERIYHCGASSKDAGNKITTIMQLENVELYHEFISKMLNA